MNVLSKIYLGPLIGVLLICCNTDNDTMPIQETSILDATGTALTLKTLPSRLVSLGPSNTEILFALNAGHLIVGVDDFSRFRGVGDEDGVEAVIG